MPTLYFSARHKQLVEELCKSTAEDSSAIFPRYRDLMLFAAMVGKKHNRAVDRVGNGGEVESNYFSAPGFDKEGVVYLLGLLDFRKPEVLKDGAQDCWKRFESYCAGGMELIESWLQPANGREEFLDVLQQKILELAREAKRVPIKVKRPKLREVT